MLNLTPTAEFMMIVLHFMTCTVLLCGMLVWIERHENKKQRTNLAVVWFVVAAMMMLRVVLTYKEGITETYPVLPIRNLYGGFWALLILFFYPVEVVNPGWLKWRTVLFLFSPLIAVSIVLAVVPIELNLIRVYNGQETPVSGSMNFHGIWMGLIGLFSLLSYPAAVLHPKIFNVRDTLLLLSPVLLTIAAYIVWHMATGTSMNYRYLTFDELWANRFTVPVVLRSLMLLFFIAYLIFNLRNIWQLISVYQKYSDDNYSNATHNVGWLRLVVIAIGSICSAYLLVLIWKHPVGEIIYVLITGVFFVLLSINAFSHKLFTQSEHTEISWRLKKG